jgi:DNA-binding MarR family transcriptional regulator
MTSRDRRRRELLTAGDGDLRVVVGRIARRIKQLYDAGEVTFSETSVLSRLNRAGAATPSSLATAEHVKPQAIAAILHALEKRGLVRRTPDEVDGRRVVVAITAAGGAILTDKGRAVSQRMAGILDQEFNASERQILADAVPLLDRLAGLL